MRSDKAPKRICVVLLALKSFTSINNVPDSSKDMFRLNVKLYKSIFLAECGNSLLSMSLPAEAGN